VKGNTFICSVAGLNSKCFFKLKKFCASLLIVLVDKGLRCRSGYPEPHVIGRLYNQPKSTFNINTCKYGDLSILIQLIKITINLASKWPYFYMKLLASNLIKNSDTKISLSKLKT